MKLLNYVLLASVVVLAACSDPFKEPAFNSAGSFTRSNSYENYSDFEARIFEVKYYSFEGSVESVQELKKDDSLNETLGSHFEPLVVGTSDFYLPGADASFSLISKERLVLNIYIPDSSLIASRPVADKQQNYYFITLKGNIYAYSNKGKMLWTRKLDKDMQAFASYSDLLALADGIVFGSASGKLLKLDYSGKVIFEKQFGAAISKSFAADESGNVYFGITHNEFGRTDSLAMVNSAGHVKFTQAVDYVRIIKNPVVAGDNIYIAGLLQTDDIQGSLVACYNKTGHEKWRQEIPVFPRYLSADKKGNLIVTGYNTGVGEAMSGLFAYNPSGKQIWRLYISAAVTSPLLIGSSKIAVIGTTSKGAAMFFLDKNSGKMIFDKALNELPTFYSTPAVLGDGSLIFSLNQKKGVLRLTDTPVDKILPW